MAFPDDPPPEPFSTWTGDQQWLRTGGGYRLLQLLGRGAFGEVWRAEAPGGVEVAVKIISRTLKQNHAQRELEALQLIKGLRHQNLLSLQAFFSLEDRLLIVLELADGSLRSRLEECRRARLPGIPPAELLCYFREAAEALDYLHEHQVHHRDIKPDNLLLLGPHIKVADFGLARLLEKHSLQTATYAGTPAYMAPELWNGQLSLHSDQYSLAIMYVELRVGRRPFVQESLAELMNAHLHHLPELHPLRQPEQQVLRKALAKDPQQRYPSCLAFVRALQEVLSNDSGLDEGSGPATASTQEPGEAPAGEARAPSTAFSQSPVRTPVALAAPVRTPEAAAACKRAAIRRPGMRFPGAVLALVIGPLLLGLGLIAWRSILSGNKTTDAVQPTASASPLPTGPATDRRVESDPRVAAPRLPRQEPPGNPPVVAAVGLVPGNQPVNGASFINAIGMKLAWIPSGQFLMGSPRTERHRDDDEDEHAVEITRSFYLGVHEVTQAQYQKIMGINPSCFSAQGRGRQLVAGIDTSQFPVECVSWNEAVAFCQKLSALDEEQQRGRVYRLPTEAEWEYACRGGTTTAFHYGDSLASTQANFNGNFPYGAGPPGPHLERTTQVGSYAPNAWGLYDMHGNVWEWCLDSYERSYYQHSPRQNPACRQETGQRVMRGGGWTVRGLGGRSADRVRNVPEFGADHLGFRVVCDVPLGAP